MSNRSTYIICSFKDYDNTLLSIDHDIINIAGIYLKSVTFQESVVGKDSDDPGILKIIECGINDVLLEHNIEHQIKLLEIIATEINDNTNQMVLVGELIKVKK